MIPQMPSLTLMFRSHSMSVRTLIRSLMVLLCLTATATAAAAGSDPLETRRKALDALLAEHWQGVLARYPEFATILGDGRYNDRWSDSSLAALEAGVRDDAVWIERFEAIDPAGFPEADALNRTLMLDQLREGIEQHRLRLHLMPL